MAAAGYSRKRQFWAAVATSAPQPVGAIVALLAVEQVQSLLPFRDLPPPSRSAAG